MTRGSESTMKKGLPTMAEKVAIPISSETWSDCGSQKKLAKISTSIIQKGLNF